MLTGLVGIVVTLVIVGLAVKVLLPRVLACHERLLKAAPPAEGPTWQPIETAPRGKIVVMFAVTDRHEDGRIANWKMATGHADFTSGELTWDGDRITKPYQHRPTHWMPLPAPPAETKDPQA